MKTDLGRYIVGLRESRGWNQGELARQAGVNRAHLSQVESGKIALPSADFRRRLAAALGVSHVDILVAAGELAADEAIPANITHYHPDATLARLVKLMADVEWNDVRERVVRDAVTLMHDVDDARRSQTTDGQPRQAPAAPSSPRQDTLC